MSRVHELPSATQESGCLNILPLYLGYLNRLSTFARIKYGHDEARAQALESFMSNLNISINQVEQPEGYLSQQVTYVAFPHKRMFDGLVVLEMLKRQGRLEDIDAYLIMSAKFDPKSPLPDNMKSKMGADIFEAAARAYAVERRYIIQPYIMERIRKGLIVDDNHGRDLLKVCTRYNRNAYRDIRDARGTKSVFIIFPETTRNFDDGWLEFVDLEPFANNGNIIPVELENMQRLIADDNRPVRTMNPSVAINANILRAIKGGSISGNDFSNEVQEIIRQDVINLRRHDYGAPKPITWIQPNRIPWCFM